jgi:hypothetical protein
MLAVEVFVEVTERIRKEAFQVLLQETMALFLMRFDEHISMGILKDRKIASTSSTEAWSDSRVL